MLHRYYILPENNQLCIWEISETEEELRQNLSEETLADKRFRQFRSEKRRLEWLAVRNVLKTVCEEEKTIDYEVSGKPFLRDSSFNISISHTKGYVAVLLSKHKQAGVDIEQPSDKALRLKERFMHPDELATLNETQAATQALLHWSAKEAMFKVLNEQVVDFVEHLRINPFDLQDEGLLTAYEYLTEKKQKFRIHYQVFDEFVLTWTFV